MTSWNAANDFVKSRSGLSRNAGDTPEHRPVGLLRPCPHRRSVSGTTGRTDLGVGYAGRGAAAGLPSRNPIGFAPAADPERVAPGEPRFHTEISFKRHQSPASPRASSRSDSGSGDEPESDSDDLVWKLPAPEPDDRGRVEETQAEVLATSTTDGGIETKSEAHDEPAAEEPQMVRASRVSDRGTRCRSSPVLQA